MDRKAKKYLRFLIITGFWAVITCLAEFAQEDIAVESNVDRSNIYIGDVVHYSLIITHGESVRVEMPGLAENLGAFEIRDYKVLHPEKHDDMIVSRSEYLISTFDTGEFEIPSLEVRYLTAPDTMWHTLKSEPIKINVKSLNPDAAGDIRDIKPPLDIPREYGWLILLGAISLGVLLIIGLAIWFYRRYKAGKSIIPIRQKPPRPPHEIALEALDQLFADDLIETGRIKEYYTRLSEIIREYIAGRYFIDAMEMTTTDLLEKMKTEQIENEYIEMIRSMFSECDLVKFAKYIPDEEEIRIIGPLALEFINKTKLIWEEPEQESEEGQAGEEPVAEVAVQELQGEAGADKREVA